MLGAASGAPWRGVAVVIALVSLHLLRVARPLREIMLVAAVVCLGELWDSALVAGGLLEYHSGVLLPGTAPDWIAALWGLFAAQLNTTYAWLKPRIAVAALLGAIAGPLSFRAGAALGALRFVETGPATVALAIGWAVLVPAAVILSRRWDGVRRI